MRNAKLELIKILESSGKTCSDIIAYKISRETNYYEGEEVVIVGKHNPISQLELDRLDFEYDDGYGGQELFGVILFDDNTWLERGEYDGAEWWEYKRPPTITEVIT